MYTDKDKPWFTREVRALRSSWEHVMLLSSPGTRTPSELLGPTWTGAWEQRSVPMDRKSNHTSRTHKNPVACDKASSQSPVTGQHPHRARTTETSSTHLTPSSAGLRKTTPPHQQKPRPARTMKHLTWTQLMCGGPYSRWTPEKLQVLTTYRGVCSETVLTHSQVFLQISTTPLWAKSSYQHASKPPPSYRYPRIPQPQQWTTTGT